MKPVFGVVGSSGELGAILASRIASRGLPLITHDILDDSSASLEELLSKCDIVHWCIPAESFKTLGKLDSDSKAVHILHDSVMSTSQRLNERHFKGRASVVHLLMNEKNMAVVAKRTCREGQIKNHLLNLGFNITSMTIDEHDAIMARSQAPLALFMDLASSLQTWHEQGLLTASGQDFHDVIMKRRERWTGSSLQALRRNPELSLLLKELNNILSTEVL